MGPGVLRYGQGGGPGPTQPGRGGAAGETRAARAGVFAGLGGGEEAVVGEGFVGGDGFLFELFGVVDAGDEDLVAVVVGADDHGALFEVPHGEFEVVAGDAEEVFEFEHADGGGGGFAHALEVEGTDDGLAFDLFRGGALGGLGGGEDAPAGAFVVGAVGVVGGALFGVAEDAVGVGDLLEAFGVAGFGVIGVEALGEEAVDALDGIGGGFGADFEEFVEVLV